MHPRYTLPSLFNAAAEAAGDEPAVFVDGGYRSWTRWRAEADALARGLQDLGIGKGDVVAVHLPNCWEFLTVHIAVAAAGAVMLPLHMGLGVHELHSLLARTRAVTLVVTADRRRELTPELRQDFLALKHVLVVGDVDDPSSSVLSLEEVVLRWAGSAPLPTDVAPEDPFVLLPSSGTTSLRQKICVHTHHGLVSNAVAVAADAGACGTDTILSGSLFTHLFGLLSVHLSLVTRGRQALLSRWDVEEFLRLAGASEATVLFAVPAQIRDVVARLGSFGGVDEVRLREVRASGAAVPATLIEDARRLLGAQVIAQWGMSELGAGLFTRPGDPLEAATSSVGRPVSGGAVRVVAEDGSPCAPGATGQLQFRSPFLFTEYFEDPELTRTALTSDGWLRTGDRASMNDDGTVAFRGRDIEVINVGGAKFSAPEIETLLDDMAGLGLIAVVGRPDDRLGEYPCLVVTLRDSASVTLDDVAGHLAAKGVAEYKIPVELVVLDEMPCTPTGKIARSQLVAVLDRGGARTQSPWAQRLRALPPSERLRHALDLIREQVRAVLEASKPIGPDQVFTDYGLKSLTAVRLRAALVEATGFDLPATIAYDLPTPNLLARHLCALLAAGPTRDFDRAMPIRPRPARDDPVVVVGMGCRLPGGVASPAEFWDLLAEGRETIGDFPTDRGWEVDPDATYARRGSFLDAAWFDPAFFGISPREAVTMDPQQRLLLETAWEALEHARIDPVSLRGSDTGVFVGVMASDYLPRTYETVKNSDIGAMTGNAGGVASGRISYVLGLHGPALTVDTACSSSLVALHLAARSLRDGECSLAMVGGATVLSTPAAFVEFAQQNGLAADGRCKPFAAAADGTGWGEAVGVLVLERLSDARRAGHRVLGVIRGSAVNSDGTSNGLTAPNGPAQQRVIRQALADAGLEPSEVDAVEAHGTGTTLGDPIEANAILATYGRDRGQPLLLGSLKSNLGHSQAAAGIVGTIKMLMAIRHGLVPKTLHVDEPSPHVAWAAGAVRLAADAVSWPETGRPRRAGVSAFGISGTNAHVIIEQAPTEEDPAEAAAVAGTSAPMVPLVFSASTKQALAAQAERLDALFSEGATPADVGYSLATTRARLEHRAVVFDRDDLAALASWTPSGAVTGRADLHGRIVFVFPGHGAQWAGMGAELLGSSPVFADAMAECEKALSEFVDWSLAEVIADESALRRTEVVQPVLFAVTVSLARLWQWYGVVPDAVIGHSFGEIAAAHVAGVLSLRDAVRAIVCRGALCAGLSGQMLSIESDAEDVEQRIAGYPGVSIAARNGPSATVVAGDADAVTALATDYREVGVPTHVVQIGFASHSVHVEPLHERMSADLSDLRPQPARMPWYSTVTGKLMAGPEAGARYWYDNLRQPVSFASTVNSVAAAGFSYFVEVGPHPVLTTAIGATVGEAGLAVGTLRRGRGGIGQFAASLARAYVRGLPVDWARFFDGRRAGRVDLPTYPFQRSHYWLGRTKTKQPAGPGRQDVTRDLVGAQSADDRELVDTSTVPARGTAAAAPSDSFRDQLAGRDQAEQVRLIEDLVRDRAAALLGHHDPSAVASHHKFLEIGFDSLTVTELQDTLNQVVGLRLPPITVFEAETPAALARRVFDELIEQPSVPGPEPIAPLPRYDESVRVVIQHAVAAGNTDAAFGLMRAVADLRPSFGGVADLGSLPAPTILADGPRRTRLIAVSSPMANGGVHQHARLAAHFQGVVRVSAVPLPGFTSGEKLPASAEAAVAAVAESVHRAAAGEPFVLFGYSSGGALAYAAAHHLKTVQQTRPAAVIMIDTFRIDDPTVPTETILREMFADSHGFGGITSDRLSAMGRWLATMSGMKFAPLDVPVLFVQASEPVVAGDPARWLTKPFERTHDLRTVRSDHFGLVGPDSAQTAQVIREWLDERL
ncbi:beta-ketoacyl synthase N-terminal-like domain-containing protein [Nocardia sp. 2YAB30]|uniref:type I polyketide synthase n=1 Tax=unclassified Nocardia TaxID=2637762 RepID=UPI003F9C2F7A